LDDPRSRELKARHKNEGGSRNTFCAALSLSIFCWLHHSHIRAPLPISFAGCQPRVPVLRAL